MYDLKWTDWHWPRLLPSEYFGLSLSGVFHQWTVLIHSCVTDTISSAPNDVVIQYI